MIIQRRNFLIGLASMFAAPAIVRIENIMPVRTPIITDPWVYFQSWPIGEANPPDCYVGGFDLLSRAKQACSIMGQQVYLRDAR